MSDNRTSQSTICAIIVGLSLITLLAIYFSKELSSGDESLKEIKNLNEELKDLNNKTKDIEVK